MITRSIIFFGKPAVVACDEQCSMAWGIHRRPTAADEHFLSDAELAARNEAAPSDPGTYEGGEGKPQTPEDRLNRWCVRECERLVLAKPGATIRLQDCGRRWK